MAMIPDEFRIDIFGEKKDDNNVLVENVNTESVEFALGFDIDGDVKTTRFWFYSCTATRPSTESKTTEDTKEPTTDTLTVSCAPLSDGNVRVKTTEDTTDEIYSKWYDEVYVPVIATV